MVYGHPVFLSDLIVMVEIETSDDAGSVCGILQCTKPQAQATTVAYGESSDFTDKHFVGGCRGCKLGRLNVTELLCHPLRSSKSR